MVSINKNIAVVSIGRVLQTLLSIFILKVLTYFLEPNAIANYFLLISVISYFGLTIFNPTSQYFNRQTHRWQEAGKLMMAITGFSIFVAIISILSIPIIYFLKNYFGILGEIETLYVLIFVSLGVFFFHWFNFLPSIINILDNRVAFVLLTVFGQGSTLVLSIFLIQLYGKTAEIWCVGQLIGWVLTTLISFVYLLKMDGKSQHKFSNSFRHFKMVDVKKILDFVFPLVPTLCLFWFLAEAYRFAANQVVSLTYVGILGVTLSIPQKIGTALESFAQQLYTPIFLKNVNTENQKKRELAFARFFNFVFPLYLITLFFVVGLSPFLISILTNETYLDYYYLVMLGAGIQFMRNLSNLFGNVAHAEMNTKILFPPYLVGSLIAFVGIVSFGHQYPVSIAVSLLVGCSTVFFLIYFKTRTIIDFHFNFRSMIRFGIMSLPFLTALLFGNYARQLKYCFLIIICYGTYYALIQIHVYLKLSHATLDKKIELSD